MRPHYYGVIGNRDHIKFRGTRRPFWEFLDVQPDGWLSSLVYKRRDVPTDRPMIWDCGAWSYRHEAEPTYSPEECLTLYEEYAPRGSMAIAPDHMLIPGVDLEARRAVNLRNAATFLRLAPSSLTPMVTIHGDSLDERLTVAAQMARLGYRHFAIGGLAARAAKKEEVTELVRACRDAIPGYLHVLGLSSPEYARRWRRFGVDSFDGSSHFKQAFTGGAWFSQEGMRLVKHQVGRRGEAGMLPPECACAACGPLRGEGIDTRCYGSNEHNMGRAAHNLNMLMRAQQVAMQRRIVLVACCGEKREDRAPAKDLYQSPLFRRSRAYAERHGDTWFILSAKHGLLNPATVIEPYDQTLTAMAAADRRTWTARTAEQLRAYADERLIVLAGNRYCEWTTDFPHVERPLAGMGIGQQLAFLTRALTEGAQQGTLL